MMLDSEIADIPPYEIRKINKKLVVVDATGRTIYSMPNWIRVNSRQDLQRLADLFNQNGEPNIMDIMEFETKFSVKKSNKPY